MKKDKQYLLLQEKNIYKAFAILATPVFLSNLLKSFHDLVDTYFIGQMENSVVAQAGISVAWPALNILLSLVTGLSVAGVAVVSQCCGAGDKAGERRYAAMLLELCFALGAALNVLVYFVSPAMLRLMGVANDPEVYRQALIYLRVRSFEMLPFLTFSAFQAIRQAHGDTVSPVALSIVAVLINVVLTGVFVQVYHMGVFGAALATMIGQAAVMPAALWQLFGKRGEHMRLREAQFNWPDMGRLCRIAAPSACSQALSSLGFLVLQSVILSYGAVVAAAFSIGNKVSNLLLMPVMALGSVLAAFIGQNVGAANSLRARKAYQVSRNLGLLVSVIGALAIYPFRRQILSLLTNSQETLAVAMEYIFWVLSTQPAMAMFQNYLGVFNGSGNTRYSFAMAVVRLWCVRLPLIYVFQHFTNIGHSSVWYAMVISNILLIFLGMLLLRRVSFAPVLHGKTENA